MKQLKFFIIILVIHGCNGQVNGTKNNIPLVKKAPRILSDSTNTLSDKIEELELEYVVWGCACANWISPEDRLKYEDSGEFEKHCIHIEAANPELEKQLKYFEVYRHRIKVKGQFYTKLDVPKGTVESEEILGKAKVFRYTKIEIIAVPEYKPDTKVQTLKLHYNAISCTCAKWSESGKENDYYYLEAANSKLIDADKLFDGEKLPVEIEVTGQIVSENGFPTGFKATKGEPEAGKVFRYTKIRVLN